LSRLQLLGVLAWLAIAATVVQAARVEPGATDSTAEAAPADVAASPKVEFNSDVRPILMDVCISCHGPDSASRKADLRLDKRDAAVEMAAITPGDPDSSEMIRRILSEDAEEVMPPPETKKHLTEEQKQTLVRWIEQGAEYQPHWSFIAPTRPELPPVKN
jgi:mono/diheme cytochrome c family protein